ncbi:hypothetical protein Tco_0045670 [Tanacetum coccineum]
MAEQDTPPPTITAIRKGEYDIWSMRMRQYIYHTDHNLWDVIVVGTNYKRLSVVSADSIKSFLLIVQVALAAKRKITGKRVYEDEDEKVSSSLLFLRLAFLSLEQTLADKYVADILKKFDYWSIRTAFTPIESNKPLVKDEDGEDVDVHVYRSMIGSLMYLTASRPYIMDSPFDLEAFSNSDYRGTSLDRKSTTGGCQFLGSRLIYWQCKKQTIVANSTTEEEYVAAANCCGQVLWIQNQMMDYGFNFMNTRIHIDNESTISVIKNPVAHSRTKHIEIRFHFIRDCYEKRLIEVIKIHTDSNVADLLTKGFDVTRFNFLVSKANGLGKDFPNPFMAGSLPKTIKQSNDPPLSRGYTLGSGEDSLELKELMANCTQIVCFVRKKNREIWNVTPLFPSMLDQPTEDEGAVSERPSESQPTPSLSHPSEDPIEPQPDPSLRPSSSNLIHDSIPDGSDRNHGGQSSSDRSLSRNEDDLKSQIKQLKKKAKPVISHHNAWIKSVSMKKRLARKNSVKKKLMQKEYVSKQGRKPAKSEPTVQKDPAFDDLDDIMDDAIEYMETEDAQDKGMTSSKTMELSLSGDTVVFEEKASAEKEVSTKDPVSTAQLKVSTNKPKVSTNKDDEGTVELKDGNSDESATLTVTSKPNPIVFGDDETIAQVLITMSQNKVKQKEKEKGVEIKDTDRPRTTTERSILTLKPLPKIDPKAKGKKKIEEEDESDTESEDIIEAEKKFKMIANDEEVARKVQEEWEAEENKKILAKEEATMAAFTNEYDFIQARLNADKILAEKL